MLKELFEMFNYENEEEALNKKMRDEFEEDRTSLDEFDISEIQKIAKEAVNSNPKLRKKADKVLQFWMSNNLKSLFVDNNIFNKLYKQYEQLKDSNETPIIKLNKLQAITKELRDNAEKFDDWEKSDEAFKKKHEYYSK